MIAQLLVYEYKTTNIQTTVLGGWHVLQVAVKPSEDIPSFPAIEAFNNREHTYVHVQIFIYLQVYFKEILISLSLEIDYPLDEYLMAKARSVNYGKTTASARP